MTQKQSVELVKRQPDKGLNQLKQTIFISIKQLFEAFVLLVDEYGLVLRKLLAVDRLIAWFFEILALKQDD